MLYDAHASNSNVRVFGCQCDVNISWSSLACGRALLFGACIERGSNRNYCFPAMWLNSCESKDLSLHAPKGRHTHLPQTFKLKIEIVRPVHQVYQTQIRSTGSLMHIWDTFVAQLVFGGNTCRGSFFFSAAGRPLCVTSRLRTRMRVCGLWGS